MKLSSATRVDNEQLMHRAIQRTEMISTWPSACIAELLGSAQLLQHVRAADLKAYDPRRRELLIVVSGLIEVSVSAPDGRRFLHSFIAPGILAPVVHLLDRRSSKFEYHAHVDSLVIHVPVQAVIDILNREPILWRDIATLAMQRASRNMRTLQSQLLETPQQRLADALIMLAQQTGTRLRDGAEMVATLSQADLASILGVTRQTMNQELGKLYAKGILRATYKRIVFLDVKALRQLASGG